MTVLRFFFLATLCSPSTPMVWQILIRSTNGQLRHVQVRPCPVIGASDRCTCAVGPSCRLCFVLRFFGPPCAPRPPQLVGISRCASTPRQRTVEVCASQGPQQARPPPYQCPVVGASRRCTCAVGPSSRLCFLAITNPRSCWFFLSTMSWR